MEIFGILKLEGKKMRLAVEAFAQACYDQNKLSELNKQWTGKADKTDMKEWGLSVREWKQAVKLAYYAKLADKGLKNR